MKKTCDKIFSLVDELQKNENIDVTVATIAPGYSSGYIDELEHEFGIEFNPALSGFFNCIQSISLSWSAKRSKFENEILEEDLDRAGGSIQVFNPFDMIMGKNGRKWKDVIWFDNMDTEKKKNYESFVPFDFPTPEMAAGFRLVDKKLADEILLYDSNKGIIALNMDLESYLETMCRTKAYYYWQELITKKDGEEIAGFKKIMPLLFPGFDANIF